MVNTTVRGVFTSIVKKVQLPILNHMQVVVTSRHAVTLVDLETGHKEVLRRNPKGQLYYGITWSANHIYLAGRRLQEKTCYIEVLDKAFNTLDIQLDGRNMTKDVHQLYYDPTLDAVYITATGVNVVVAWSFTKQQMVRRLVPTRRGKDTEHLNSVFVHGGYTYITAHAWGKSKVYTFKGNKLHHTYTDMGMQSHNVYVTPTKEVMVLSSNTGHLVTNKRKVTLPNQYPRGLAVTEDHYIIGKSMFSKNRETRYAIRDSAVQVYDHAFNLLDTIDLNEGMIFEVRGIDFTDLAHNHLLL